MTRRLLVASGNPAKLAELRALCADLPLAILEPRDVPGGLAQPAETGATFRENAAIKALAAAEKAAAALGDDVWALADDSGLEVDALQGEPGVRSARYAGAGVPPEARDRANIERLLRNLQGVPPEGRGARFVCVLAVARRDEVLFAVEGCVEGRIAEAPAGSGGFGYDPVFYHEPSGATFACLTPEQKAAVSHRGRAARLLRRQLEDLLRGPR